MPIYEFYCQDCHTLYSFFTARLGDERRPACPRCGRQELPRRPSRFATPRRRGATDEGEDDPLMGLDESRLEGAMESLLGVAEGIENEEDPRAMARLMRRFGELSGLELGERMEDFVSRLEAGEDPDSLERELEEAGDDAADDLFQLRKALRDRRDRRPKVDEELYFF